MKYKQSNSRAIRTIRFCLLRMKRNPNMVLWFILGLVQVMSISYYTYIHFTNEQAVGGVAIINMATEDKAVCVKEFRVRGHVLDYKDTQSKKAIIPLSQITSIDVTPCPYDVSPCS